MLYPLGSQCVRAAVGPSHCARARHMTLLPCAGVHTPEREEKNCDEVLRCLMVLLAQLSPVSKTLQVTRGQESPPITEVICAVAVHAVCAELSLAFQDVG